MAESQALLDFFTEVQSKGGLVVTELPKFELESYIQNYPCKIRYERLIHIGCTSPPLCIEALRAAVIEAKQGNDVKAYTTALEYLQSVVPNDREAVLDRAWVDRTTRENQATTKQLEAQLKSYKNNLIKDSIRMGHEDLAKHLWSTGALPQAYEALAKMRADVQLAKHVVEASKLIIELAIEQRNWIMVSNHVAKIKQLQQDKEEDNAMQPFAHIAAGLAHLAGSSYRQAAIDFLSIDSSNGTTSADLITPNDVAIYGSLCALASMDRNEMQIHVLDNPNFRAYLELEPHLRRAVTFFVNSRFPACLEILAAYRADYQLDIWLSKHISEIYEQVRSKAIIQYCIPFSCVSLDSMNTMFGNSGKPIENELIEMIEQGALEGRIDTQNRLLTSVPSLARSVLQTQTLETARDYAREARRRIQRMNLINADLEVKGANKAGKINFNDPYALSGGSPAPAFTDVSGFQRPW